LILDSHYFPCQGPLIRVGRQSDNAISFDKDKSISRNHAEIELAMDGSLKVKDLGSKFGTFIEAGTDKTKVEEPTALTSGQTVRFGALNSTVTFLFVRFAFCTTRIEKQDKDLLKSCCKMLKGKIVNQAEDATHLVSNKFAATVKMLTAIVLNLKIVTLDWFSFLDQWESRVIFEIPDADRFVRSACCCFCFD
jgi:hypothetical protein